MTEPRIFNGQDINLAAAATRSILDTLLERESLTFPQYVALRGSTIVGEPTDRETMARQASGPAADEASIQRAIDQLDADGLVSVDELSRVAPTGRGRELYERIRAVSVRAGDELFEGIAREDLEVTKRVLDQVTERAVAVRARL
jgi:DNA-binding MarR family transcriptional regulator